MATTTHSLHHHRHNHRNIHHHNRRSPFKTTSVFLKPTTPSTTTLSLSPTITTSSVIAAAAATATSSSADSVVTFDVLAAHLSAQNFREADEETRRLLILLAGESAQKRGYVFFSEVQFISPSDLKAIDELWRTHSNNRFGYSVQRKIWQKVEKDFTKFFIKVGWMKKLETEVEQYNYRAFPNEFTWELGDDTPEGHLPLTNALRGTQLLSSILSHPAFEKADNDEEEEEEDGTISRDTNNKAGGEEESKGGVKQKMLNKRVFKPDYSF